MPELVDPRPYVHDDGRLCYLCKRWEGNPRDGQEVRDYWRLEPEGWRYCGTVEWHARMAELGEPGHEQP